MSPPPNWGHCFTLVRNLFFTVAVALAYTGVPRDSLAAHTPHTSPNPFTASTYLQTAKQLLDQLGLSGPAAQTFFDKQVARILAEDPARLESWLAGWILAAHHNASSASTPCEARDSLKPEGRSIAARQRIERIRDTGATLVVDEEAKRLERPERNRHQKAEHESHHHFFQDQGCMLHTG